MKRKGMKDKEYYISYRGVIIDSAEATKEGLDLLFLRHGTLLRERRAKIFRGDKELEISRTIKIRLLEDDKEIYYLEDFY